MAGIILLVLLAAPVFFSVRLAFDGELLPQAVIKIFGIRVLKRKIEADDIAKGKGNAGLMKAISLRKIIIENYIFVADLGSGLSCVAAGVLQALPPTKKISAQNWLVYRGGSRLIVELRLVTSPARVLAAVIKSKTAGYARRQRQ